MLSSTQRSEMATHAPVENLGKYLCQKRSVLPLVYDFAVDGGAVSTIKLRDALTAEVADKLPSGAIITQVYADVKTACASAGGTGTIALTANSAGDLLAAVDADTKSGIFAGIPIGTAGTMVKLTADRQISLAIATEALTAGKLYIFVEYVISQS